MKIFRKGFNYSQDGPGNRLVYHLQGCNFQCKWCSNPESMGDACPACASYTVDELADEARRSALMFFGGGGVTLTGGEPTVQFGETAAFLRLLKQQGIHTAVETNGSHPNLPELLPDIDFLIMDFKHYDEERHRFWTGVSGRSVRKNLEQISRAGRQALIRIPVINGVNVDPEGFAEYFETLDCGALTFEFLAYHEFGKDKWTRPYEIEDGFVSDADMAWFRKVFEDRGLKVTET